MANIRWRDIVACMLGMTLICGCATRARVARPGWIQHPKSDDSVCMYRVGHAGVWSGEATARKLAFSDALAQFSQSLLSSVKISGEDVRVTSAFVIKGAEILSDCVYYEKVNGRHECWVQVSFPLDEKHKILNRLEAGEKLNALWVSARTDFNRSKYVSAREKLQKVISDYEKALHQSFRLEEAQLLMADSCSKLKDFLPARQWYENLIQTSSSPWRDAAAMRIRALPPAPKSWPLYDRFGGSRVALICCMREGDAWGHYAELGSALSGELRSARLQSVDVTRRLDGGALKKLYDGTRFDVAVATATSENAGIVLAIYVDIDHEKRGKTEKTFDVVGPAIDTRVSFFVISTRNRSPTYEGSFKEIAGTNTDTVLAAHTVSILIQKYLVSKCPPVK